MLIRARPVAAPARRLLSLAALLAIAALLAAGPARAAEANHPLLFSLSGNAEDPSQNHPPDGGFEAACGVAVDSHGDLYVSDYYHHAVDVFSPSGHYESQIAGEDPLDGPCGLALDPAGDLFVNNYHRDVVDFAPAEIPNGAGAVIDSSHSTGLAVDPSTGELYVDDRTYVAAYAAPVHPGEAPVRIGEGTLGEGYGLAVSHYSATAGDLYVADAATGTVKVYDPAHSTQSPEAVIDGAGTPQAGFADLTDSSLAVDPADGHLYVVDDTQPGFEHPAAVVDEFNAQGDYRGQISHTIVDAEPSGLAVNGNAGAAQGDVYVTSGNSEGSKLYAFGPTAPAHILTVAKTGAGEGTLTSAPAGIDCGSACAAEYDAGAEVTLTATPAPGSAFAGWSGAGCSGAALCHLTLGADRSLSAEFEALPPQPLGLATLAASPSPSAAGLATTAASPGPQKPHPPAQRRHRRRHRKGSDRQAKGGSR